MFYLVFMYLFKVYDILWHINMVIIKDLYIKQIGLFVHYYK